MDEADAYRDRLALMHLGRIRAIGTPGELKASLGDHGTLDEVFRHYTASRSSGNAMRGCSSS